jgi:hypothetical protein
MHRLLPFFSQLDMRMRRICGARVPDLPMLPPGRPHHKREHDRNADDYTDPARDPSAERNEQS